MSNGHSNGMLQQAGDTDNFYVSIAAPEEEKGPEARRCQAGRQWRGARACLSVHLARHGAQSDC